ncbi:MAG: CopD family protein [Anaerolineae bacterium]|nr:CopD family protein [Anaerolineae bacterium]
MNPSLTAISYFFHLLATVIWLGGMALLVLVIWPAQRHTSEALLDTIEKRFRPMANFSLLVLLMTGVVQTSSDDNYGGMLDFSNDWSKAILGKHLVFIGMIVIVAFLQFGLEPALERAKLLASRGQVSDDLTRLRERQHFLTRVNFVLSLVVLVFTAIATAL